MKPISPLSTPIRQCIWCQEKENNANKVNNNTNTKDLTQKSKDFTIFISEICQYIVEIQGFIRIS